MPPISFAKQSTSHTCQRVQGHRDALYMTLIKKHVFLLKSSMSDVGIGELKSKRWLHWGIKKNKRARVRGADKIKSV